MGSPLTTTGLDESRDEPRRPLAPWPSTGLVKPLVLAAAAYTALSVVLTWPLAANLTTHLPHDLGDPVLSSWLLWWHAHHLPFTAAWWDGAGFFPVHGTLALSDHRIGLSLIGSPLIWLGGSGVLAYNVALMFSFAASALAMHGLVLALTRRHDAATLAAVVFGFAPYRFDHVVHLEIVSAYWLPIALLGLHLWLRARETRWLALFSACWLLQALTCGYYFFYFAVLLGLWTVWFLRSWRRDVLPVALAGLATLVPLLPVLLYYKGIHSALGLRRGIDEIELFSADISGLLSGAPWLAGWSISPSLLKAEGQIYPGLIAVLLVVIAAGMSLWRTKEPAGHRARRVLLVLALIGLAVVVSVPILGAWRVALGPLSVSVSQAFKPLSVGLLALAAYGLTSPAFVAAYRGRSVFVFYAVATPCMWMLAFGPAPHFLGTRVLYKAPYAWLMALPPFEAGLRVPARFAMLASLCLAVAAGLALARLLGRAPLNRAAGITAVLLALMVAEVWSGAFPLVEAPRPLAMPESRARDRVLVELPLGGVAEDAVAIYHSMTHRRPVVNGYSGYDPPHYALLRLAVRLKDPRAFDAMARRTGLLFAVHKHADRDDTWEQYLRGMAGVTFLERSDNVAYYEMARLAQGGANSTGSALPIRNVVASVAQDAVSRMRDGRLDTWWATPTPQRGGEQVVVELEAPHEVCGAGLALGPVLAAFPRQLELAVSVDGQEWRSVWTGSTAGLAVDAALGDPKRVEVRVDTTSQPAIRFVRLRQAGEATTDEWAIAELSIRGCGA